MKITANCPNCDALIHIGTYLGDEMWAESLEELDCYCGQCDTNFNIKIEINEV